MWRLVTSLILAGIALAVVVVAMTGTGRGGHAAVAANGPTTPATGRIGLAACRDRVARCGQQIGSLPRELQQVESSEPGAEAPPGVPGAGADLLLPGRTSTWTDRPLAELSPAAASYLATCAGRVGVAVVVPTHGAVYGWNPDILFPMASVAKVAIMALVMDRAALEERDLTEDERALLEQMITVSDNDAASVLWAQMGGGEAVAAYLRSIGLLAIYPDSDDAWGASPASAKAVGLLFAKLAGGEILSEPFRSQALELLSRVVPEQSWGVTAGISAEYLRGGLLGIKNGWYPADDGWRVHSAGMILPAGASSGYVVAIMTDNQPSMTAGIETIEALANFLNRELQGIENTAPAR